jgi:hypothetical protein
MNKMDRREFMKAIGAGIVGIAGFGLSLDIATDKNTKGVYACKILPLSEQSLLEICKDSIKGMNPITMTLTAPTHSEEYLLGSSSSIGIEPPYNFKYRGING